MEIIVKTVLGLEQVLAKELETIGVRQLEVLNRAVKFEGDMNLVYQANLLLRTAMRVLVPIHSFTANNEREFYRGIQEINWQDFLSLYQSFAIHSVVNSSVFTHSKFMALKAKDAIVDQFRDKYGKRPNVSTYDPDRVLNVHINGTSCTVSLDSSGDSLQRRGYKVSKVEAPVSEVLAAGILMQTDFESHSSFHDPMCGSGTFLSEALMIHAHIPPNYFRQHFAFMKWKEFSPVEWRRLKESCKEQFREPVIRFSGSDVDIKVMFAAKKNLFQLPFGDRVSFSRKDFITGKPSHPVPEFIIMNPPYDLRLQSDDIMTFYSQIGTKLKHDYMGATACIFTGNLDALKKIGLKPSKKISLMNGQIPSKLHCYELYAGSRKSNS